MKLQGLAVIFIIIIVPILLLLSYYISLQIDTINMQTSYDTKLLQSAKDAIGAFEINTVEWNDAFSQVGDSKRRDIMASLNTFTTSFANSIGVGGTSKEIIMSYIPAIVFTMYDGYYIYSPSEVKEVIKDENGVAVFVKESLTGTKKPINYDYNSADENRILYACKKDDADGKYQIFEEDGITVAVTKPFTLDPAKATTTYSHILKPLTAYSARYKKGNIDIVVNYTLDNYITIYGQVGSDYVKKSGYLIDVDRITLKPSKIEVNGVTGVTIEPENLTEKIAWKKTNDDSWTINSYPYVYEAENNTKVYFDEDDGNKPFQVSSTGIRTDLEDLSGVKYKKIFKFTTTSMENREISNDLTDFSAINYYGESYLFSKWVGNNLGGIKIEDMVENNQILEDSIGVYGDKAGSMRNKKIFDLNNIEDKNSTFNLHKREVIKQSIITNLNQAITSYSRNSAGNYYLPVLSETDWNQILENVSIIAFLQGIPIGLKKYNNYAIATSTSNREYVDPNEIYLSDANKHNHYYHLPYCSQLKGPQVGSIGNESNLIGYRSTDYRIRTYSEGNPPEDKYYYKHEDIANQACYNCLVQRSLYKKEIDDNEIKKHEKAYLTALAREKYVARKTELEL